MFLLRGQRIFISTEPFIKSGIRRYQRFFKFGDRISNIFPGKSLRINRLEIFFRTGSLSSLLIISSQDLEAISIGFNGGACLLLQGCSTTIPKLFDIEYGVEYRRRIYWSIPHRQRQLRFFCHRHRPHLTRDNAHRILCCRRINVHHDKAGNLSRLFRIDGNIARNRLNGFIPVRGVGIGAGIVALTLIGYPVQDVSTLFIADAPAQCSAT